MDFAADAAAAVSFALILMFVELLGGYTSERERVKEVYVCAVSGVVDF